MEAGRFSAVDWELLRDVHMNFLLPQKATFYVSECKIIIFNNYFNKWIISLLVQNND